MPGFYYFYYSAIKTENIDGDIEFIIRPVVLCTYPGFA